jgi:hypothetical protein
MRAVEKGAEASDEGLITMHAENGAWARSKGQ